MVACICPVTVKGMKYIGDATFAHVIPMDPEAEG